MPWIWQATWRELLHGCILEGGTERSQKAGEARQPGWSGVTLDAQLTGGGGGGGLGGGEGGGLGGGEAGGGGLRRAEQVVHKPRMPLIKVRQLAGRGEGGAEGSVMNVMS